jgi:nucleotide-binding universal stress UspA family protein
MIKTILVPAGGSDADEAVFATALAVARRFSAHLNFLHVRLDAAAMAVTMSSSEGGGSTLVGGLVDRLEEAADRREQRAREMFERFCAREGLAVAESPPGPAAPSAGWMRQVGPEPFWVAEHGRAADLIVVGRPVDGDGVAPETIETALLTSGRPLLIAPAPAMTSLPETIVIAWKATREAAHAVTAASPFLSLARRIRVLTVAEEDDLSTEEGGVLTANLRWRGTEVAAERLRPERHSAADTLLAAAAASSALVVMGGYGHSRLHEWMFGGFTRHVLQSAAPVPVLIAH